MAKETMVLDGKTIEIDETSPFHSSNNPTTEEEIISAKAADVRAERNYLLRECDWTQCSDVPENIRTKWQSYRQALRDITKHEKFPSTFNIDEDFPDKPS